jgi:hypothetical protein
MLLLARMVALEAEQGKKPNFANFVFKREHSTGVNLSTLVAGAWEGEEGCTS